MSNYDLLPIELQTSVRELRAAGTDEEVIDRLIARTLAAIERPANRATVELYTIVERMETKLDQDISSRLGSTNTMLADLRSGQQTMLTAIQEVAAQQGKLETQVGIIDGRVTNVEETMDEVQTTVDKVQTTVGQLVTRVSAVESEVAEVKQTIGKLTAAITAMQTRDALIERFIDTYPPPDAIRKLIG